MDKEFVLYEVVKTFELTKGEESYQLQLLKDGSNAEQPYTARCYRLERHADEYSVWLMREDFP